MDQFAFHKDIIKRFMSPKEFEKFNLAYDGARNKFGGGINMERAHKIYKKLLAGYSIKQLEEEFDVCSNTVHRAVTAVVVEKND